jgi:hypothetical protein
MSQYGYLDGYVDEVRVSYTNRSDAWIETEYNNQHNPSGFYDISFETLTNLAPVLSFEVPVDDATDVDVTQATVNVTIEDPEGDSITWTIEGEYVTNTGATEGNGSKIASLIVPLPFSTSIVWYVNASDGIDSTEVVYDFITRTQYVPSPPAGFTATAVSRTQIDLSWTPDSMADTTLIERNSVASWVMGAGTEIYNGSDSSHADTSLTEGTQYFYQAWSWNMTDHVYSTSYAFDDATTFSNLAPVLSFENPLDNAVDVAISQAGVNVTIRDPEGDPLDWTIEGLYVNDASGTSEVNGSKQASLLTPLPYDTNVVWYVNASDGIDTTEVVYDFTTESKDITDIMITPSTQTVNYAETFIVSVYCDPAQPIESFEFDLDFDASLIQANIVTQGDIFHGFSTYSNNGTIDNIGGYIDNVYCLITEDGNVTEPGYLANISFTSLTTSGTSPLLLVDIGITNESAYVEIDIINGSVTVEFLGDAIPPEITDMMLTISDPKDTVIGWENFSCAVTDNIAVNLVQLNLTYPDMHTENISMTKTGDTYYHNTTLMDNGTYSYFIWVNDTSDNRNSSSGSPFELPPNWDILIDHDCNIIDLIQVANHFDETGPLGWIREDVNNDGDVSIVDLIQVSNHFDETW